MIIGVFDSGLGGLSVSNSVKTAFPNVEVKFVNDREHVPYGKKGKQELLKLALPLLKKMEQDGCNVIVIACNTLTTTVIKELRENIDVPLVAVEPMVKPAAVLTKNKTIAVCATPATLSSKRYSDLKQEYAKGIKVIEPDCSNWAELIEKSKLDQNQIKETVEYILAKNADVIVLGCTHYHWIEEDIQKLAGDKAVILQPEEAIIRRLKQTLEQLV